MLFFGLIWLILILLVITVLVLGIVALVRFLAKSGASTGNSRKTPLTILNDRYAKGEIDQHEYERIKKEVESES